LDEGFKGSLEVGMAVDVVVLTDDLSRVRIERLCHLVVVMTVIGSEVVYEA
jgi:predicted amidohydrolase YtcJ